MFDKLFKRKPKVPSSSSATSSDGSVDSAATKVKKEYTAPVVVPTRTFPPVASSLLPQSLIEIFNLLILGLQLERPRRPTPVPRREATAARPPPAAGGRITPGSTREETVATVVMEEEVGVDLLVMEEVVEGVLAAEEAEEEEGGMEEEEEGGDARLPSLKSIFLFFAFLT